MAAKGKLKITINHQLCLGDGACCEKAPSTFKLGSDGITTVRLDSFDDVETVIEAARACRMDAITVEDLETGEQLVPAKE
jgi:ferredoxin